MVCVICDAGSKISDKRWYPAWGHKVKLRGGYNTTLCDNHANEWHEYIVDNGAYIGIGIIGIRLAIAKEHHNEEEMLTLYDKVRELEEELYKTGKRWVANKIAEQ